MNSGFPIGQVSGSFVRGGGHSLSSVSSRDQAIQRPGERPGIFRWHEHGGFLSD
jgi:hypothetical protein